ncbi:MAG TPA: ATP-binding cassette domain-containing protein [Paludibacter sp.]|nr:ATP-binding cassette domain-containing protein [Paludibacter sp.]
MNHHTNIGLYLSNTSNKNHILKQIMANNFLQQQVDLSPLHGVLFSSITIDRFIEDELRHDHFPIQTNENSSLSTMSSGQQKRALLMYLIAQKPEFMVLDDVYSNIDKKTQEFITNELSQLSGSTLLIQLFFRKRDLLPCIDTVYTISGENEIIDKQTADIFRTSAAAQETGLHRFSLPAEYNENHTDINPLVQLNAVSVRYGEKKVLDKVNWTIQQGEFWQLVGPNGSGKSTMLSIIIGDNPRGYGQDMILFGRKKGSGESIWDIKRQIGYFTPAMIEQFTRVDTVENMIISGLMDSVGLYTKPTDLQKDIAKNWIKRLGENYRNRTFQSLSLGQQRMVMVARAMVKHPPLLILDEPTIELDDENSRLFIDMVNAIAAEKKIAIVYVSHRDEQGLQPDKIFELVPTPNGHTGVVIEIER